MATRASSLVAVVRHREAILVCGGAASDRDGATTGDTAAAGEEEATGSTAAAGEEEAAEDDADRPTLPRAPLDGGEGPEPALDALLDRLGLEGATVERRGDPVEANGGRLVPFLVATGEPAEERPPVDGDDCADPSWSSPAALLRGPDDRWWRAYAAVAPTVETVAADAERGSTAIAADALWALRDAALRAAADGAGLPPVVETALALLDARPSMAALGTRVDRTMAGADAPAAVAAAAGDGLVRALEADAAAADLAAETVDGGRVLTLSRSGTVRDALLAARPAVVVLASRPGGEGPTVAEELAAAGLDARTVPDADVYDVLRTGDVDAVLVGADAVTADGWVVNKVGTRAAALAAERAGVPCFAVCASDKVRPAPAPRDEGPRELPPLEPLFDETPPRLLAAVLTERGPLERDDVAAVAAEHRELARWREAREVG